MNESVLLPVQVLPPDTEPTPAKLPGAGLSPLQRHAVELVVTEGLTHSEASNRLQHEVHQTTISTWFRTLPEVQEYADYLSSTLITETRKTIQLMLARRMVDLVNKGIDLALGSGRKGKPSYKGQDKFLLPLIQQFAGTPARSTEVAVHSTGTGSVTIVWKARE